MSQAADPAPHPPQLGRSIVRLATLNINGLSSPLKVGMLHDFLRRNDVDILLAQEVTQQETLNVWGYNTHLNIGTTMRGTAILARQGIFLTNIRKIPSGRAIAATCNGLLLINVYAPSGTARRTDTESFFTSELPYVLQSASNNVILGGDFNCALHTVDSTGTFVSSRALTEIIRGLHLTDAWSQDPLRPTYTHYSPTDSSRIDRLYMSHRPQIRNRDHTCDLY
jgi:exonuclease III